MASAEEWRPVPAFEGRYEVSNLGHIRTWLKSGPGKSLRISPKIMSPRQDKDGYLQINLSKEGGGYAYFRLHRLILLAFRGEPIDPSFHGCHDNGDKNDCCLSNLRWDNAVGNQADRIAHGTDVRGTKQPTSKLVDAQVLEIRRRLKAGEKQRDVASEFGVSQMQIFRIHHRQSWSWL